MEIFKEFSFQAAHRLPNVGEGHKCARLHGHSYRITVTVAGIVDPDSGMVMDFDELSGQVSPVIDRLDHQLLNDIDGLENPTSENLCRWLWARLDKHLPLSSIAVRETSSSGAIYRGETAT